jgi:hypothetical protein
VAPVELEGRPIVTVRDVAFDPEARRFALPSERGGAATVSPGTADETRIALDTMFDAPVARAPFAMVRSLDVTAFNNAMARIAVREAGANARCLR